ncbi:MAG TPA: IS481 family transposase [Acidimicrobiales bacterium]|nr:IS481 family transposase [Acidimicrobiales bacterium]
MHANAPLTVRGRMILVGRIASGRPVAHVAAEMGISRKTADKWWKRWLVEGEPGLEDRSSRPRRCPHQTPARLERRIIVLRQRRKLGPARIASIVSLPTSTVHRVLSRHGLNRLAWMDRPSGRVIRRIQTDHPGELVHIDVKKLGRIPPGGGWRAHGRGNVAHQSTTRVGYDFVHSAIDAHSRLAFSEVLSDEKGPTCAGFFERAQDFFGAHGIVVEAVLTDNARNYLGQDFTAALGAVQHRRIRPRRPQTNGKVERLNRTLLEEWACVRIYTSNAQRTRALDRWLHTYNHHRGHTSLGGRAPIEMTNLAGQHI